MPVPEAAGQSTAWQERPEAGGRAATRLMRVLAFGLGRPLARCLTFFAALYFMLRRGPERAASRVYLARILGRRAGWLDVYRHFLCFSTVTLDRVYLMADQFSRFDVRIFGYDQLVASRSMEHGVLLLSAHLGSFDALRVLSLRNPDVSIRDPARRGPEPGALRLAEHAQSAAGLDHHRCAPARSRAGARHAAASGTQRHRLDARGSAAAGNPAIAANFLGARAAFPSSPWLFASALRVPVVLAFGLYRGGNRYDLHFERFAFELPRDRRERTAALEEVVQRFADRLAHFARQAPYNWFNLYDFWDAALAPNPPPGRTADDEHGVGSQP